MFEINNVAQLIEEGLNKIPAHLGSNQQTSRWTKEIKETLATVGKKVAKESKIEVITLYSDNQNREWLYDVVWKCSRINSYSYCIGLVAEAELHTKEDNLTDDFIKILSSNAILKVFITWVFEKQKEKTNEIISLFQNLLNNYELLNKGEKVYLYIYEDWGEGKFRLECIEKK